MTHSIAESEAYLTSYIKMMKENDDKAVKQRETAMQHLNNIKAERNRLEELFRRAILGIDKWSGDEKIYKDASNFTLNCNSLLKHPSEVDTKLLVRICETHGITLQGNESREAIFEKIKETYTAQKAIIHTLMDRVDNLREVLNRYLGEDK